MCRKVEIITDFLRSVTISTMTATVGNEFPGQGSVLLPASNHQRDSSFIKSQDVCVSKRINRVRSLLEKSLSGYSRIGRKSGPVGSGRVQSFSVRSGSGRVAVVCLFLGRVW